ncbi:hypothetical protein BKH42_06645 [Helicobacter sp. 13S00482-2]|nr:hypothetical protein BKH42_06645 [Helicobacter sp. 13S00482-2]
MKGTIFLFDPICQKCLENIKITPRMRVIDGISVYSFYRYDEVSMLIGSKYSIFGSRVLKILAKKASEYFFESHNAHLWGKNEIYGLGIDDCIRSYYSHSAVILKEFCKYTFKPSYGALKAKNIVHYAGKTLQYRQNNPRNFIYKKDFKNVFIVDDIITTGTTIKEAKKVIEKTGTNVLFGIVLCDAKN